MANQKKGGFWNMFSTVRPDLTAYFRRNSSSTDQIVSKHRQMYSDSESDDSTTITPTPDYDTSDTHIHRKHPRRNRLPVIYPSDTDDLSRKRKRNKKKYHEPSYESDSEYTESSIHGETNKSYVQEHFTSSSDNEYIDRKTKLAKKSKAERREKFVEKSPQKVLHVKRTKNAKNMKKKTKTTQPIVDSLSDSSCSEVFISPPQNSKRTKSILKVTKQNDKKDDLNWTLKENHNDGLMLRITMEDLRSVIEENVRSAVKQTMPYEDDTKHVRCISPDLLTTDTDTANSSSASVDLLLPGKRKNSRQLSAFHAIPQRKVGLMKRFLPHSSSSSENSNAHSMQSTLTTVSGTSRSFDGRRPSIADTGNEYNQINNIHTNQQLLKQTSTLRGQIADNWSNTGIIEDDDISDIPIRNRQPEMNILTLNELSRARRRHSVGVVSYNHQNIYPDNNFIPLQNDLDICEPGYIAPMHQSQRRGSTISNFSDWQDNIPIASSRRASLQYVEGGTVVQAPQANIQPNTVYVRRPSTVSTQGIQIPPVQVVNVADPQIVAYPVNTGSTVHIIQDPNQAKMSRISSELSTVAEESVQSKDDIVKEEPKPESEQISKAIPTTELLKRRKEKEKAERKTKMMKLFVVLNSILVVLAGLGVLGLGVLNMVDVNAQMYAAVTRVSPNDQSFQYYCYGLCLVGVSVTLVWFCGCLGAMKVNECLLKTFITSLVLVIVLKLGLLVMVYVSNDDIASIPLMAAVMSDVGDRLLSHLKKSIHEKYVENTVVGKAWDILQIQSECCGSEGSEDYMYSAWRNSTTDKRTKMPDSCCVVAVKDPTDPKPTNRLLCQALTTGFWHKTGCYEVLFQWFQQSSVMALSIVVSLLVLEILCILFSVRLLKHVSSKPTVNLHTLIEKQIAAQAAQQKSQENKVT